MMASPVTTRNALPGGGPCQLGAERVSRRGFIGGTAAIAAAACAPTAAPVQRAVEPEKPLTGWEKEWAENLFDAAVARVKRRVKEGQFQMFDLYVMKKWPVEKVAGTLGVSSGQVYLAKHRIGGLIKKEVQRLEKNLI